MSLDTGVGDEEWMASWTIFYWAWWYSWGPFVGMFVARISRGRTIREFMIGVIVAPTGFGFLWFAAVGGTWINIQETGRADLLAAVADSPQSALFLALDVLPVPLITSVLFCPVDGPVLRQWRGRGGDHDGNHGLAGAS